MYTRKFTRKFQQIFKSQVTVRCKYAYFLRFITILFLFPTNDTCTINSGYTKYMQHFEWYPMHKSLGATSEWYILYFTCRTADLYCLIDTFSSTIKIYFHCFKSVMCYLETQNAKLLPNVNNCLEHLKKVLVKYF